MKISDNNKDQENDQELHLKTRNNDFNEKEDNVGKDTVNLNSQVKTLGVNEDNMENNNDKAKEEEVKPYVKDSQREGLNLKAFL